jgi:hypothetical protein
MTKASRVASANAFLLLPENGSMELIQFIKDAQDVASAHQRQCAGLALIDWEYLEVVAMNWLHAGPARDAKEAHKLLEGVKMVRRMMEAETK